MVRATSWGATSLLFLSLFSAAVNGHVHVHTHECSHDHPETRRAIYGTHRIGEGDGKNEYVVELGRRKALTASGDGSHGPEELYTALVSKQTYAGDATAGRSFQASAVSPIRIVFRTLDLSDSTKYCTSATDTTPDFQGNTVACTADTVFNATHRTFLTSTILPRAAAVLSGILNVVPISGNLIVSASTTCGGQYTIPAADRSPGVANADLVVYVSAGPNTGSTIAWAGYCALDTKGRPVVARVNFSPKYLNAKTKREIDYTTRVAVHELTHALGFSGTYIASTNFAASKNASAIKKTTRRKGQPVTLFTGANALAAARTAFACSTTDGVELEDEGGSGTIGSHWERRTHKEDVMAGIAGDVMTYSALTFGLLADSGHYTITKTKLETEYYMSQAGCGVFTQACNTTSGGSGRYFCFATGSACTPDFGGFGPCGIGSYTSPLPLWAQYFAGAPLKGGTTQLMDYCPVVTAYSNRLCNRYDNTAANNTNVGLYFGSDGRCFKTTSTLYKGNTVENGAARCFKSRCVGTTQRIEFLVGDSTTWTACPTDGSAGVVAAPSPYTGSVTCPTAASFCPSFKVSSSVTKLVDVHESDALEPNKAEEGGRSGAAISRNVVIGAVAGAVCLAAAVVGVLLSFARRRAASKGVTTTTHMSSMNEAVADRAECRVCYALEEPLCEVSDTNGCH